MCSKYVEARLVFDEPISIHVFGRTLPLLRAGLSIGLRATLVPLLGIPPNARCAPTS